LWRVKETKGGEETEADDGIGGGEDDGCTEEGGVERARDWGGGRRTSGAARMRDPEWHRCGPDGEEWGGQVAGGFWEAERCEVGRPVDFGRRRRRGWIEVAA
jgi:hypothetical protein